MTRSAQVAAARLLEVPQGSTLRSECRGDYVRSNFKYRWTRKHLVFSLAISLTMEENLMAQRITLPISHAMDMRRLLALRSFLLILTLWVSFSTNSAPLPDGGIDNSQRWRYGLRGEVTIAGLFPICERLSLSSDSHSVHHGYGAINNAQAFTFAVERHGRTLSARNGDGQWRNLSLGYIMADICGESGQLESTKLSLQIIPSSSAVNTCPQSWNDDWASAASPLALVGPTSNAALEAVAPLLGQYGIPLVSPQAYGQALSCNGVFEDELNCQFEYEYLYRASSPDSFISRAFVDLAIQGLSADVVGVIYQENDQGRTEAGMFLAENSRFTAQRQRRLCIAFFESIPSDLKRNSHRMKTVVALVQRHKNVRNIFLFATSPVVSLLMKTFVEQAAQSNTFSPRVWIGRAEQWGTRDIIYNQDFARATLSTSIHLQTSLPSYLEWFYQTAFNDFADDLSGLTLERLSPRDRLSNPWLCPYLETTARSLCLMENDCLLEETEHPEWTEQTCNVTNTLIRQVFRDDNGSHVEQLGAVHTLLAAEIVIQAIEDVLQEFVQKSPNTTLNNLARNFISHAFGRRLNKAIRNVKLGKSAGCPLDEGCPVFVDNKQDLGPASYFILATNAHLEKRRIVGRWTAEDASSTGSTSQTISSNSNLHLFDSLEEFKMSSSSPCSPLCIPGEAKVSWKDCLCCYSCQPCEGTTFSNTTNSSSCQDCHQFSTVNSNHTECIPFSQEEPPYRSAWLAIMAFFWCLLVFFLVGTTYLFKKYHRKRAIHRNIFFNTILLAAMMIWALSIIAYFLPVNEWLCKNRSLLMKPWLTTSIATLLVRTLRLARLVRKNRRGDPRLADSIPSYRQEAHVPVVIILTLIGVLTHSLLTLLHFDPITTTHLFTNSFYYIVCHTEIRVIAILYCYLIALLLITCALAFTIRKLPSHKKGVFLREARPVFYITILLSLLWTITISLEALSDGSVGDVLVWIREIFSILTMWMFLFLPKLYEIRFGLSRSLWRKLSFRKPNVQMLTSLTTSATV